MKTYAAFLLCSVAPFAAAGQGATVLTAQQKPAQTAPAKSTTQAAAAKPASAIDPAKEAAIRKLFEVSGIRENMQEMLSSSIENTKPTMKRMLPPGEYQDKLIDLFFEKFKQQMKVDDLLELVVPIYDKYFSLEDIDGVTKFYETPAGKKTLSGLTQVMIESQAAGMKFGEEAGRQAMAEVLKEHPELQKALEEAAGQKN